MNIQILAGLKDVLIEYQSTAPHTVIISDHNYSIRLTMKETKELVRVLVPWLGHESWKEEPK